MRKSMPEARVTSTNNGGLVVGVFASSFGAAAAGFATGPLFAGADFFGAAVCATPHKMQLPLSVISRVAAAAVTRRFLIFTIVIFTLTDRVQWPCPPQPVAP